MPPRFHVSSEVLGVGNFGKVTVGIEKKTGRRVAIKRMNDRGRGIEPCQPSKRDIIEHEIAGLRKANSRPHPNVIRLYGVWSSMNASKLDGTSIDYYIATELCRGELFELVNHNAVSEARVRELFRDIVSGLAHLHENGVCHCDLKLENILLDNEGVAKIGDLGLCFMTSKTTSKTTVVYPIRGSPPYCAPEVYGNCANRLTFDDWKLADVWSLGVIVFSLQFGFFPFQYASAGDWRFKAVQSLQQSPPPRDSIVQCLHKKYMINAPEVSVNLVKVIDDMLCVNPKDRVSVDVLMASAFFLA